MAKNPYVTPDFYQDVQDIKAKYGYRTCHAYEAAANLRGFKTYASYLAKMKEISNGKKT